MLANLAANVAYNTVYGDGRRDTAAPSQTRLRVNRLENSLCKMNDAARGVKRRGMRIHDENLLYILRDKTDYYTPCTLMAGPPLSTLRHQRVFRPVSH